MHQSYTNLFIYYSTHNLATIYSFHSSLLHKNFILIYTSTYIQAMHPVKREKPTWYGEHVRTYGNTITKQAEIVLLWGGGGGGGGYPQVWNHHLAPLNAVSTVVLEVITHKMSCGG